jgi:hypothetical protein
MKRSLAFPAALLQARGAPVRDIWRSCGEDHHENHQERAPEEINDTMPAGPNRAQRRAMRSKRGVGIRFRYVGGPYDGQFGLLPHLVRSFKLSDQDQDEDGNDVTHVYEPGNSTRTGVEYRYRETLPSKTI